MEKLVFYGKTEAEIEDSFPKWRQANAGPVPPQRIARSSKSDKNLTPAGVA